jgi:hypothetical protein
MSADKNTLFERVTSDGTIKNSEKIILKSPKANEDHSDKTCQTKENGVCALLKEHLTNEMFDNKDILLLSLAKLARQIDPFVLDGLYKK